jgi:hypothetical protein
MVRKGHAVLQLVEALRFCRKVVGSSHWNVSLTQSFRPHFGTGVDSAANRNEYQEYFVGYKDGWCVRLTTLALSCADCLEIRELRLSGTLRTRPSLYKDCCRLRL